MVIVMVDLLSCVVTGETQHNSGAVNIPDDSITQKVCTDFEL